MCLKSHGTDVNIFRFKTNYMASPQVQYTFSSFSTMLLCTAEKIPLGVVSSVVTALKKNPAGNVNIFILTFSCDMAEKKVVLSSFGKLTAF